MNPAEERTPEWGFEDLALLIGAILPVLLLGTFAVRLGRALAPAAFAQKTVEALAFQATFYLLMLGALYMILVVRHRTRFWESLGWTLRFRGAWWCVAAAPVLMVGISVLGGLMRTPEVPNPWGDMITGRASQVAVLLFASILGPVWEELMFRGFLYPVLARLMGPWLAIIGAAIPFGLIHGAQYQWQWQQVVLVALSGVAFGFARYKTGSTAASALMHSAYNTGLFVVVWIQRG